MSEQTDRIGRDGTALGDLGACDAPPLQIMTAEEAEDRRNKAEAIQIGDGRYAIIVDCDDGNAMPWQKLVRLRKGLENWWKGGSKFVVLQGGAGVNFRFERMPDD